MRIDYYIADPTGNITILVNTPILPKDRPRTASLLMEAEPGCEQVGFLSEKEGCDIALDMAGGEFCGNASMSAGVIAAMKDVKDGQPRASYLVRCSGAKEPVRVEITGEVPGADQDADKSADQVARKAIVQMPGSCSIREVAFPEGGPFPVVFFDGIAHVILTDPSWKERAEELAPKWCRQLNADAAGLMFLDEEDGRLTPLVYVPAADTLFWENSCASGTSAVGAFLAKRDNRSVEISLRQPGGSLSVFADPDGNIRLGGSVRILKKTSVQIEL